MLAYAVLASLCVGLVSSTVVCPDGGLCQDRNTCCLTKEGYGCCNDPFAVCCSDQLHCCPAGYHCSSAAQSCVKDGLPWYRLAWLKHTPAQEPESTRLKLSVPEFDSSAVQETTPDAGVVKCDNTYSCRDDAICCIGRSGNWSCCPHQHGRCCRDGIHCCPFGFYCNRASTKCLKGDLSIDATPQMPAVRSDDDQSDQRAIQERPPAVGVEQCDEDYRCSDGQTCCLSPIGTWTCCRYSRGHCCRDGYHCCPSGYICDSRSYRCLRGYLHIDASPQLPALKYDDYQRDFAAPVPWATLELAPGDGRVALTTQVIRCVGRLYCPDGNSCCQSPTGEWGCCPHLQGQCCLDGKHCCEYKWTCDSTSMSCARGGTNIPSSTMKEIQLL
ncbi:progranulin-like isoform X2 [Sardina pilchardus]|uniref:progranulin-like isoform X2 n=1 Tax=Sardina pilchardus TaxID=27697 RepID=UPI002E134EC6